jgi:hypothetical protein
MNKLSLPLCLALAAFLCAGCGPTYPSNHITDAVRRVVKKEYHLDSTARLVGATLYLDVRLTGLTSTDPQALAEVLKKVQGAVLAITRVSLSSDAQIRYTVVTAKDPSWKLSMRIIQRLDDVKAFLYQKISHADYEERLVLEINGAGPAAESRELDVREFAGRLIVSQINMLGRTNPFLSAIVGNSQLEYIGMDGEELTMKLGMGLAPQAQPLFEDIVMRQSKKVAVKYSLGQLKRVRIITPDNSMISLDVQR